jgi:hypothetical protein
MLKYEDIGRCLDSNDRKKAMHKLGALETRIKFRLNHETDELAKIRFFNELKTLQRIKEIF